MNKREYFSAVNEIVKKAIAARIEAQTALDGVEEKISIPNSYTDIYNLLHILFPHEYDEFFDFTVHMLRNPGPDDVSAINDKLQPFFCRTTKDQLGVPKANDDILCVADATSEENLLLRILQMRYGNNKLALRFLYFSQLPVDIRQLSYIMSLRNGYGREIDMKQSVSNSE